MVRWSSRNPFCLFGNISILASVMSSVRTIRHNVRIRPVRKLTSCLVWDPLYVQSPAWGTHSFSVLLRLICFWNLKIGCFKRGTVLSSKAGKTANERTYVHKSYQPQLTIKLPTWISFAAAPTIYCLWSLSWPVRAIRKQEIRKWKKGRRPTCRWRRRRPLGWRQRGDRRWVQESLQVPSRLLVGPL